MLRTHIHTASIHRSIWDIALPTANRTNRKMDYVMTHQKCVEHVHVHAHAHATSNCCFSYSFALSLSLACWLFHFSIFIFLFGFSFRQPLYFVISKIYMKLSVVMSHYAHAHETKSIHNLNSNRNFKSYSASNLRKIFP